MIKEYIKEDATIVWDSSKCIHAGACSRGLPTVFKPKDKPWVQVEHESKDDIIAQVNKCPSSALSIK